MAKGYWFAQVDIADADAYRRYQAANAEPFRTYGARFLVRGGTAEVVEGAFRSRQVIIEFPSYEAALECYRSDLYQAAKALRAGAASGDIVVLAGYDGVQPLLVTPAKKSRKQRLRKSTARMMGAHKETLRKLAK